MKKTDQPRNRRGAAAVELAVLLPFLSLMFAAALDFARVYHASQVLENSAAVGARYVSGTHWVPGMNQTACNDTAKAMILANCVFLDPPLQEHQITISFEGSRAVVRIDYGFPMILGTLYADRQTSLTRTARVYFAPRPGD